MQIQKVTDAAFSKYGKVIEGLDCADIIEAMGATPCPAGVTYVPGDASLEACASAEDIAYSLYGGMPIQIGYCNGNNHKLNGLEYHRDSEINCGTADFILLVAREDDIAGGVLDTDRVRAFRVPRGVVVEVYATTLHYAPCSASRGEGFRVLVALPRGTNGAKPEMTPINDEDKLLWACNKWLLAHAESAEAAQGAVVALKGANIDIEADI